MSTPRESFIKELTALVADLIPEVPAADDKAAEVPGIQLTVGANEEGWGYQTGDTSFYGDAYSYSIWGRGWVYRDSDPAEVARLIVEDLESSAEDCQQFFYDVEEREDPDEGFGK